MLQSIETPMSLFLEVPDLVCKFTFHLEMSLLSRLVKAPSTGTSAAFAIKVYCWIYSYLCVLRTIRRFDICNFIMDISNSILLNQFFDPNFSKNFYGLPNAKIP